MLTKMRSRTYQIRDKDLLEKKNTSEDNKDIPNELKGSPDAPLVKDRVSKDKDCSVGSPIVVEKKIDVSTITKVKVVRQKQQEKPVRKLVYSARPMSCFSKSAQSTVKRPYQQRTTLPNKSFIQKVNNAKRKFYTARPRAVNTARPRPVNTARPKPVNTARPRPVNTARLRLVNTGRPNSAVVNAVRVNQAMAKVNTVNGEEQIQALLDKKKVIITETSVRSDLHLKDAEGTEFLLTATIFKQLTLMGAMTTAWNEFSSTMASAIICLATNQNFSFSKYIFDHMKQKSKKSKKRIIEVPQLSESTHDVTDEHVTTTSIDPLSGVALVDETRGRNDQDMFDTSIFDEEEVVTKKKVSTADPVTTAGVKVSTAAITSQISMDDITLAKALVDIKTSKPKAKGIAKDKGKAKMIEPEKPLKKKDQIMIDEEVAKNLEAQMQAALEEEERLVLFNNTMKWIDSFVPMDTKLVKGSEKVAESSEKAEEGSSKRAAGNLEQKDAKKRRIKEENEFVELKRWLEIIPEDDNDVTIEATPLSSKSLTIVDYKIYKERRKIFFKIIIVDGGRLMKAIYLNEVFGYIPLMKTKLLIKKLEDLEGEHQV
uniref:Uncharacterized protein n=1 Tax=Tanacetum cinerariifolium TaxID=118510 RepID=A0A699GZC8_TANCI|nr:hypothetical protein [Tanacetum cinerariifolium]